MTNINLERRLQDQWESQEAWRQTVSSMPAENRAKIDICNY